MKLNDENLRKQKELNEVRRLKEAPEKSTGKDRVTDSRTGVSSLDKGKKLEGRGTKRSRDMGTEPVSSFSF